MFHLGCSPPLWGRRQPLCDAVKWLENGYLDGWMWSKQLIMFADISSTSNYLMLLN